MNKRIVSIHESGHVAVATAMGLCPKAKVWSVGHLWAGRTFYYAPTTSEADAAILGVAGVVAECLDDGLVDVGDIATEVEDSASTTDRAIIGSLSTEVAVAAAIELINQHQSVYQECLQTLLDYDETGVFHLIA